MRVSLISIYNRDEAYLSDSGNRKKKKRMKIRAKNAKFVDEK